MVDGKEDLDAETSSAKRSWSIQTEHRTATNGDVRFIRLRQRKLVLPFFLKYILSRLSSNWVCVELWVVLKLSFPITLSFIFQQTIYSIALLFVGRIPGEETSLNIDSLALANSMINVTGISVGIGLSSAADTLCTQTYGYKNYKRVGVIFQRGFLILLMTTLFIVWVWLNTEPLLLLLQQPPCVARLTAKIVQVACASLPGIFLYNMLLKYLQSQGIIWVFIICGFLANVIEVIINAVFIYVFNFGVIGIAVSFVITSYVNPLLVILYIRMRKLHKKTWGGWTLECFDGWIEFYKLGLPGVGMICMEWTSFEISAFVLGTLGEVELAINTVLINTITFLFMIPLGISVAASIRVGNELGAGNHVKAKRASAVSIGTSIVVVLIISSVVEGMGSNIGKVYNVEEAVMERLPSLIILLGFIIITDQVQGVMSGVIRGAGRQLWGAGINFIAFYIVGLPIGIPLALLTSLKSFGMWIGLLCASTTQVVGYTIVIVCLNWKKESLLAMKRGEGENSGAGRKVKEEEVEELEDERIEMKEYKLVRLVEDEDEGNEDEDTKNENVDLNSENVNLNSENADENENEDQNNEDITERLLEDDEEDIQEGAVIGSRKSRIKSKSKRIIKIILTKGVLYIIGIIGCVAAGFTSQLTPPDSLINGNYSECTDDYVAYYNASF